MVPFAGTSSEGEDDDDDEMTKTGNVKVKFCICGGRDAPEPGSVVVVDVADGGCGGGMSACAVMMTMCNSSALCVGRKTEGEKET